MFFFCLWDWSLNSDLHTWKASILLLEPYLQSILLWLFWRWGLVSYFSGCSQTSVLPISASQVARITAMSHQCLAICYNIFIYYLFFVALELELRASCLLGRCSSTWATLPALFVLVFFFAGTWVCTQDLILARQAFYHLSHFASTVLDIFGIGSHELFSPDWL
jgi:hypothetical protein